MNFSKHWTATLDDYVIDLAWSPDGAVLGVVSAAGSITLYDAVTGAVHHKLTGHENGANCLAWISTKEVPALLASGGQDGCVRFWDGATGRQTAATKLGSAWVEHLVWRGARVLTPNLVTTSTPPEDQACLFAAAGKNLVALRPDGSIAHTFPAAPKTISALAIKPATQPEISPALASAYFGGVTLWHPETFGALKELPYGNAILALTWSPDGRWLVAGCHDNAVHLWVPTADMELQMSGYETKLLELGFSRDSKWLATGGGRDACIWDCTGAGPEGREPLLLPHATRVCAVAFQNQHGLLATAALGGEFCLWAPTRKNPLIAEVKMPVTATKFAWRPDDTMLAVGTEKGAVFVFKLEN